MKLVHKYRPLRVGTWIVCALLVLELTVRLVGAVDTPLYYIDKDIGYIAQPNQAGSFLHIYSWAFNNRSLGIPTPWRPMAGKTNILVIGNSIVVAGNRNKLQDKLAPLMQQRLGSCYLVWPIAIGGWTNINETAYLERNHDVETSANFFVWEYMYGGLSQLSNWTGDDFFPRRKPLWATWYVFHRYVLSHFISHSRGILPPVGPPDQASLARFDTAIETLSTATRKQTPGILFFYPTRSQLLASRRGQEWLPERHEIEKLAEKHGLEVIDVAQSPLWNEWLYRNDGTHPTSQGNAVLARILTNAMGKDLVCMPTRAQN